MAPAPASMRWWAGLSRVVPDSGTEIVLCPGPLPVAPRAVAGEQHPFDSVCRTSMKRRRAPSPAEISAPMVREFGCRYAIVGHSERRQLYAESDELVARKDA